MARACLPSGVLLMPRDRGGLGRTGGKQKKARAKKSSQTSPQAAEAKAGAVAEAEAAAETAEQASPEADLQRKQGRKALKAHRWGLRVAEHVAGGVKSIWPTNDYSGMGVVSHPVDENSHPPLVVPAEQAHVGRSVCGRCGPVCVVQW